MLSLLLVLLLPLSAAAQPPSRPALLVLDLSLASPQVHAGMLELLNRAGYAVDYRPDHPQLVKHDVRSARGGYDAIMLLAGSTPTLPGAMLSARALAPLADFVRSGGVLFLGAPVNPTDDDAGENERTLFNALLRRLHIPIVIQKGWLRDETDHYQTTLYDAPWLYADRQHPLAKDLPERLQLPKMAGLEVGEGIAVLVSSEQSTPVIAMGRRGKGLVVVAARAFFNPTGAYQVDTPLLSRDELQAARRQLVERIAGYTIDWLDRRAEWTANSSRQEITPRQEFARPAFWPSAPLPNKRPASIGSISIEKAAGPAPSERARWLRSLPARYRWLITAGMRAGWVYVDRDAPFQRAVRDALVDAKLNLLWGSTDAELLAADGRQAEQRQLLAQWRRMDQLLRNTGVKWFMGSHYPGAQAVLSDYPPAVGAQGQTIGGMSPLDRRFWESEIFPVLKAEAKFSKTHPSVAGVIIDLEMYPLDYWYFTNGFDFGDLAFDLYLQELDRRGEAEPAAQARALGSMERFDWLVERGLLQDYWTVLMREAERIGRALRDEVRAVNPALILGFYAAAMPTGWFYEGLLRGASDAEQPVLLLTFQHAPEVELEQALRDGIYLLHGGAILLGQVKSSELRDVIHARLAREEGYWLNNAATLASDETAIHRRSRIESPKDGSAASYITAIAEANKSYRREHKVIGDGGRQGEREHRSP